MIRHQVFVSSTFRDLNEERNAVITLIQAMGHIPVGMELFPSSSATPWDVITRIVGSSDYYVLVIGGMYGSTREGGISYTEDEYDFAVKEEIPVLAFLHRDPAGIPLRDSETEQSARERLDQFRTKIEQRHTCQYWSSADDLKGQVAVSLSSEIANNPRPGWVRGTAESDLNDALRQINRLQQQVEELRLENEKLRAESDVDTSQFAQLSDETTIDLPGDKRRNATWQEIFLAAGHELLDGANERQIAIAVVKHLVPTDAVSLRDVDSRLGQKVLRQLLALGLADVRSETVVIPFDARRPKVLSSRISIGHEPSGAKTEVVSLWHLTAKGKRLFVTLTAEKSSETPIA